MSPAVINERLCVGENVLQQQKARQHHNRQELDLLRGLVDAPAPVHHAEGGVAHLSFTITLEGVFF